MAQAARNVLIDSTFQAKIADFGLARGIASAKIGPKQGEEEEDYYRSQNGVFPVRWCAPESMQTMRFSEASDVWSFGVVCLEVYADGAKPYAGMDNAAVINKVQAGYRAPMPPACNSEFYAVMQACWMERPQARPSFSSIADILANMVPKGTRIQPINYKAEATRAFCNAQGIEAYPRALLYQPGIDHGQQVEIGSVDEVADYLRQVVELIPAERDAASKPPTEFDDVYNEFMQEDEIEDMYGEDDDNLDHDEF